MRLPESQILNLKKRDKKKIRKGVCGIPFCKKKRPPRDCVCPMHRHRITKSEDPVRYTYNMVKSNARRRKKDFTITLNYFRGFCEKFGYIEGKGRTKDALSLDRIDNEKGYVPGNIRILTVSENSSKADCPF